MRRRISSDRRPAPIGFVGGQQADQRRGGAHQHEREHQHDLAAVLVAEVPGEERAERAEQEADADGQEREDLPELLAGGREEELAEDEADGRRVDEEVVPLDGGADDGREDDAAAIGGGGDGAGGCEPGRRLCGHV